MVQFRREDASESGSYISLFFQFAIRKLGTSKRATCNCLIAIDIENL